MWKNNPELSPNINNFSENKHAKRYEMFSWIVILNQSLLQTLLLAITSTPVFKNNISIRI